MAEEITQETFLRLHHALLDRAQVNHVRAWVFRVARNLAIDEQRERSRQHQSGPPIGSVDVLSRGSAPSPEQRLLAREQFELIQRELLRLPPMQRECLRLKAGGLRYHEIAATLDVSVSAAVDSVRAAVKRLALRLRAKAAGGTTSKMQDRSGVP